MKKILCICVLTFILLPMLIGCSDNGSNNTNAVVTQEKMASKTEIISDAEQRVVNNLCAKHGVHNVKVKFGTENAEIWKKVATDKKSGDLTDQWAVDIKGTCYPVDSYGEIMITEEDKFSYRLFYYLNGDFGSLENKS